MTTFRGISLKAELITEIENLLKTHPIYKSPTEFISEAIRLRMEQIKKINPTEAKADG